MEKWRLLTLIFAITVIAALEFAAILHGIDGKTLGLSLAIIALLAPSPIYQIKWGNLTVIKRGEDK